MRFRIAKTLMRNMRERDATGRARRGRRGADAELRAYHVPPRDTDSEIDDWLDPHYVAIDREQQLKGHLFTFLSGSYGNPKRQQSLLSRAAGLGYHAINLRYPNAWTVGALCRKSRDPDSHEKVRQQIIDGRVRSDAIRMSPANSIVNRLTRLLQWLSLNFPDDAWETFFDGEQVRWSLVVLAGHSQGGGHVALMAKEFAVRRVVMMAAPGDSHKRSGAPAPWLSRVGATPAKRYFGFVHRRDQGFQRIMTAWDALGLEGPATDIDGQTHPYGDSHRLVTNAVPAASGRFHGCVAVDGATPRSTDGRPVFDPVWNYLFDCKEGE